jgi:hypothetical protein
MMFMLLCIDTCTTEVCLNSPIAANKKDLLKLCLSVSLCHSHSRLGNENEINSMALEGTQREYRYRLVVGIVRTECEKYKINIPVLCCTVGSANVSRLPHGSTRQLNFSTPKVQNVMILKKMFIHFHTFIHSFVHAFIHSQRMQMIGRRLYLPLSKLRSC